MTKISVVLLACLSLTACNRDKKLSPEEEAAEAKQNEKEIKRAKKVLKTLASLEDTVNDKSAPKSMKSAPLKGTRNGYANFDVLMADELPSPEQFPKVRIRLSQQFAECASHVQSKKVYPTDCVTPYVVVLKGTVRKAEVSGSSYTPGKVDADAYVFDMKDGELIGGGHVSAKTPDSLTTKGSNPENELAEKLGSAAFDALAESLEVKK